VSIGHDGGVTETSPSSSSPAPQPARGDRGPHTVADMIRSLGLVLLLVVVVVLITFRPQGQAVTVVDYRGTLAAARSAAPFPLVAPIGLPDSWKATSAYYDPPASNLGVAAWHVGFVTADGEYAGFEQTDGTAYGVLKDVLGEPVDAGRPSTVAGQQWEQWRGAAGDRHALVRTSGGVTTVVDGSAGWAELEQLAGSLRTTG
jgi:hypothetical protein